MKLVILSINGEAIADLLVEQRVEEFIKSDVYQWKIGNLITLDYFRVLIKENKIKLEDCEFQIEDIEGNLHDLNFNKDARSWDWRPECNIHENFMVRLI